MDEIELGGRKFISARRAAKDNGYATDYIGQLIRGGKIEGQKGGRGWFVEVSSLENYLRGDVSHTPPAQNFVPRVEVQEERVGPTKVSEKKEKSIETHERYIPIRHADDIHPTGSFSPAKIQSHYPLLTYLSDAEDSLPFLADNKEEEEISFIQQTATSAVKPVTKIAQPLPRGSHRSYELALSTATLAAALLCTGLLLFSEWGLSYDAETQT